MSSSPDNDLLKKNHFSEKEDGHYCKLCHKWYERSKNHENLADLVEVFKSTTRKEFFMTGSKAKQIKVFHSHLNSDVHDKCVLKEKTENPDYVDPPHPPKKEQQATTSSQLPEYPSRPKTPSKVKSFFIKCFRFAKDKLRPPPWLFLLVKIQFLITFFMNKENIADDKFESFLNVIHVIINLVLEFVGAKKMLPFGFTSMFPTFLKIMAQHVVKKRIEALNITKFFSILFDETTDVAHLGEVMFFIVYLDLNLNVVTEYLTTKRLKKGAGGATLAQMVLSVLAENNIMQQFLISVATDGASNLRGFENGAIAELVVNIKHLISIHCFCHQFALFIVSFFVFFQKKFFF